MSRSKKIFLGLAGILLVVVVYNNSPLVFITKRHSLSSHLISNRLNAHELEKQLSSITALSDPTKNPNSIKSSNEQLINNIEGPNLERLTPKFSVEYLNAKSCALYSHQFSKDEALSLIQNITKEGYVVDGQLSSYQFEDNILGKTAGNGAYKALDKGRMHLQLGFAALERADLQPTYYVGVKRESLDYPPGTRAIICMQQNVNKNGALF